MRPTSKINVKFAERVAAAYEAMKHEPLQPEVSAAYRALAIETIRQYKAIPCHILIEFDKGQSPYTSPNDAVKDIRENYHLFVTPTRGNFGDNRWIPRTDNVLLNYSGFHISGCPALVNDIFRVVHDYFGHFEGGNGFRALGEENAYRYHCGMFSPLAQKALTTETRGQNSWVNYGPHGEHNRKAKQSETIFADQKTGLLPDFCMGEY